MKLTNPHELTQLEWEMQSFIDIVKQLTGQKPSNEINSHQNEWNFSTFLSGIREHLNNLEGDFKKNE